MKREYHPEKPAMREQLTNMAKQYGATTIRLSGSCPACLQPLEDRGGIAAISVTELAAGPRVLTLICSACTAEIEGGQVVAVTDRVLARLELEHAAAPHVSTSQFTREGQS